MSDDEKIGTTSEELAVSSSQQPLSVDEITAIAQDDRVLERYQKKYPDKLYSLIMYSLSHKSVTETEARELWKLIGYHWTSLNASLKRDVGVAVAALDYLSNIHDVLSTPILIEAEKSKNISKIATKDRLTGLITRDMFDFALDKEFKQIERSAETVSLAMIDIDDFKAINDRHGHPVGDRILSSVGKTINHSVREMDTAARYGGEEMVVLMPRTELETAYKVTERIREDIEKLKVDGVQVTVSAGVAATGAQVETPDHLIEQADEALYAAKRQGKNRVIKADLAE